MKRAPVANHYHLRRPGRPRVVALDEVGIPRKEGLLPTTVPSVERLMLAARRRGFRPLEQWHPLEGGILVGVRCRYCRELLVPRAALLQRLHAARHRRQAR